MKNNFTILILLFLGMTLFSGCSLNETDSIQNQNNSSNTEIAKNETFPDYLKLENGELYCEYGNQKNPKPDIGTIYSKQKVKTVEFPETMEIINFQYAKDKNNIYAYESICTTGMPGSCDCNFDKLDLDRDSFELLGKHHIKDKDTIMVFGEEFNNIDVKSFELIKSNKGEETPYGKDKNNVYYYGEIIEDVDYSSFEVIDSVNAKDKNNFYEEGNLKS